jgi:amino acid transporter
MYLRPDWLASVGCILALFIGAPISIVLYLDYARTRAADAVELTSTTRALGTPIAMLGLASLAIGLGIMGWVLFNVFIEHQPSYTGKAWLPSFGIGPVLVVFGWRRLRRPLSE